MPELRQKATPNDSPLDTVEKTVGEWFKNKWILYGALGGAAIVGYLIIQNANSQATAAANNSGGTTAYTATQPVAYDPGVAATTGPSTTGVGSTDDTSAILAAIQAQQANDQATQQANLAAIQSSTDIALAGDYTNIDLANINGTVANYANSTSVVSNFLKSAGTGVIGLGGSVTPSQGGGVNVGLYSASQKQPTDYTNILHQVAQQTVPQMGSTNATQLPTVNIPIGNIAGL